MAYSVFLSHSSQNADLVDSIVKAAEPLEIEVYRYDQDLQAGASLSQKLERRIEASDVVVVLLTEAGAKSAAVNQEIGVARHARKLVIPVIEKGIDPNKFTFLQGLEHLSFDRSDPQQTIKDLAARLAGLQQEQARNLMTFLLVIGGIMLWAKAQ